MASFTVQTRSGDQVEVTGRDGATLLKALRRAGVDEVEAQCGGGCACATCHVYLTLPEGSALPPIGVGEARMLATSRHRTLASRLACQVRIDPGLERMHIVVAPNDGVDF